GRGEDLAAPQVLAGYAGEVHSDARSRLSLLAVLAVRLQASDSRRRTSGHGLGRVADVEAAVEQRPRDDRAEAGHRKDAVDAEARPSDVARRWHLVKRGIEGDAEVVEAGAG